MGKAKEEFEIEKAFEQLEEIVEKLESEDTSLKDSIALYSDGAKLLTRCREELTGIEKEMLVIGESMETEKERISE